MDCKLQREKTTKKNCHTHANNHQHQLLQTKQNKTKQNKTKQNKNKNKTKQNKTKQNKNKTKTKQKQNKNKTKQNNKTKTKQNKTNKPPNQPTTPTPTTPTAPITNHVHPTSRMALCGHQLAATRPCLFQRLEEELGCSPNGCSLLGVE